MSLSKQIVWTLDEKAAASMQSKIDKSQGCNRFLWHHFRSDLDNTRDVMIHVAKVLPEMSEFAYFGISFDVFRRMHTIRKEEGVDAAHFPLHWSVMSPIAYAPLSAAVLLERSLIRKYSHMCTNSNPGGGGTAQPWVFIYVAHTLHPNKEESCRCEACEDGNKMAYGESPSGDEDIQHHWLMPENKRQSDDIEEKTAEPSQEKPKQKKPRRSLRKRSSKAPTELDSSESLTLEGGLP